jgi:hypothetical protein
MFRHDLLAGDLGEILKMRNERSRPDSSTTFRALKQLQQNLMSSGKNVFKGKC